mmetsp:Transcript_6879/g.20897  ORF Transcript_6879/g.20897 Transcript_6879/m.20897 type:complete len:205 (-) Transcript_6879:607-1221(-)
MADEHVDLTCICREVIVFGAPFRIGPKLSALRQVGVGPSGRDSLRGRGAKQHVLEGLRTSLRHLRELPRGAARHHNPLRVLGALGARPPRHLHDLLGRLRGRHLRGAAGLGGAERQTQLVGPQELHELSQRVVQSRKGNPRRWRPHLVHSWVVLLATARPILPAHMPRRRAVCGGGIGQVCRHGRWHEVDIEAVEAGTDLLDDA